MSTVMTGRELTDRITTELHKRVVGQDDMIEKLLIGLLTGGHVLLEGVPGLAKTLTVRSLADTIHSSFERIQFTPDLLPADVVGTMIYNQGSGEFSTRKGPIFANIVLADEINRAPPKVQSALLEAMQERQVTLGGETFALPSPFLVLAEPDRAGRHVPAAGSAGRSFHVQAARRLSRSSDRKRDHAHDERQGSRAAAAGCDDR